MRIQAHFFGDRTRCNPDPARVPAGQAVTWECTSSTSQRIEWVFYFGGPHPFGSQVRGRAEFPSRVPTNIGSGQPILVTTPATVGRHTRRYNDPDDYKYGVRIINAHTGEVLSDDDPIIIVV